MQLDPENVKGIRISRCAGDGAPYLTITVPQKLIPKKLFARGTQEVHRLAGEDLREINRLDGMVVLEGYTKDPRAIVDFVNHCQCPLAIEVLEAQDRATDSRHKGIALSPDELRDFSRGAAGVKDRDKEGQAGHRTVFTVTFNDAQEGLARLAALDPRFEQNANLLYKEQGHTIFDMIDGAIAYSRSQASNPNRQDVDFMLNDNASRTIRYGEPVTLTFDRTTFTVAPGQRAEDAYNAAREEARRAPPARKAHEAVENRPMQPEQRANLRFQPDGYVNSVFDSIDLGIAFCNDPERNPERRNVDVDIGNSHVTVPYGPSPTLTFNKTTFTVATGQGTQEAYDAARRKPPVHTPHEKERLLEDGPRGPGQRLLQSGGRIVPRSDET